MANKTRGKHFKKKKEKKQEEEKKEKEIFDFAFISFSTYAIRTEQKRQSSTLNYLEKNMTPFRGYKVVWKC